VAASFVFVALEDALNVIWHVPVQRGWRNTIRRRLLAFLVVLLTGVVVVAALSIHAITGLAEAMLPGELPVVESAADLVGATGTWLLTSAVILALFELLVSARVPWGPAAVGAGITAALLGLGTWALGLYLAHFGVSSVTGAAGGLLLVLVWIYYEAQILLVGAELTKVMSFRPSGSRGEQAGQDAGQDPDHCRRSGRNR
jgi:membrane protein